MTHLFSALLDQSLTACWVIPAVLLLRFCLKKAPKRVTNLLWLVVAFRLVCPVSFESDLSLVTQAQNLSHAAAELRDEVEAYRPVDSQPTVTLPEDVVFDTLVTPMEPVSPALPIVPESPAVPEIVIPPEEPPREQPFISRQLVLRAGCGIWLAGVVAMALFGLISTRQWHKRVQTAVRCEDGLWRSECVESPFILGVLRPKIYLPFVLPCGAESHVIAHERAHLKRHDPLLKCFAFVLLAVYWFHPLVWISYFLFCRDIELACDQQVTRDLDAEGKKAYSRALLACTVSRDPLLCPLSFGEVGVKARVKAVLRKNPSKVFVFTALVLCTVLIICCAANPKEEHPWDEAYRQTLEELLKQYGANEDYGLQSVTTLDLWEDGVPELVVVRKQNETVHSDAVSTMMIYEYVGGEAVLRYDTPFSKTSGNTEIFWNRAEVGVRFMVFTPLTDKADYPNVQKAQVIAVSNPIPDDWSVSSRLYNQMEDGRWIDHGPSSGYEARILDEAEVTALFADTESLMERDWQKFLKENWGAVSYQYIFAEALTQLDKDRRYEPRYTELVDFDLDGIPEMITTMGNKIYVYFCDLENATYDLARTIDVGGPYGQPYNHIYALNMVQGKPTLIVHGTLTSMEFIQAFTWGDGNMAHGGNVRLFTAKGDGTGLRSNLTDHETWHEKDGSRITDPEEYERLRAELLQDAVEYDLDYLSPSLSNSGYTNIKQLYACDYPLFQFPTEPDMSKVYAPVLQSLIAQYGFFDDGDGTLPVLGLKYAGLHDLGGDETPELVTLVNSKDDNLTLHMTLRVYRSDNGTAKLTYQTELGSRYLQTDVSYSFAVGQNYLMTYHSPSEWIEEVVCVASSLGTEYETMEVYRALYPDVEGAEPQFWIDGEAVSAGQYVTLDYYKENATEIDACWDVAPASRADLEAFLNKMGVLTHSYPPAGYGETVAAAHHSMLSGLMTVHGTTPDGIVGATIVDLEQDGVPELLVQHGMNLELYRYEKNQSRLIWSGKIGLYFGQSDVSHQYVINTHIEQPCIIVYDAEESWTEEVLRVIALNDGVVSEEVLRAWTYDKTAFFPEWENLNQFTINDKAVSDIKYNRRREEVLDGGMTVSAVHPHAYPNSDAYMADLLNQLSAGNLPEIGDSATRSVAWWLMSTNDGEPLDEQTALKFGDAFAYSAESPLGSFPDSLLIGPSGGVFDFCRYTSVDEQFWLILIDREDTTLVCEGIAYRFDENGALRVGTGFLNVDTFSASLVGDFDGQTLVHRRYHTDCYSGMEGCQDCFRSDLILWNAERTEAIKLRENVPLANHFEVIAREGNMVTITYQVGPAHSEYDKVVTGMIDLDKKTFSWLSVEPLLAQNEKPTAAYGELTYRGKTYGLPQYPQYEGLTSGEHAVEQVGKHLLITTHVNPDDIVCDVFNTETLAFEKHFWGLVLDWQGDDLTTLIYCQWNTLFTFDDLAIGEIGQSVMPKVFRVEEGWFSYDGSTFTISYSDDTGLVQQEVFPMPDREILVAANTLDGRTIWRTGLLFCPTYNSLTNTEALSLATELVDRYGPVSQWPFESCQVDHTPNGSTKLTLLQPHNKSKLCLDYTFYLQPDGTIIRAEDCIADGYSGTLVYEDDNCAIIASRRSEGCLRGGDPCGYCYVSDLTLWNADRTKGTLLLEGAELGIDFTVLDGPDENGVLSISYHTGLSHSDSTTMVFGDIDLPAGVYTETAREYMPV